MTLTVVFQVLNDDEFAEHSVGDIGFLAQLSEKNKEGRKELRSQTYAEVRLIIAMVTSPLVSTTAIDAVLDSSSFGRNIRVP